MNKEEIPGRIIWLETIVENLQQRVEALEGPEKGTTVDFSPQCICRALPWYFGHTCPKHGDIPHFAIDED